jgi:hypothetical protein
MQSRTIKILNELNQPGAFQSLTWRRLMKTRKGIADIVEKECQAVVSSGTSFANRKDVREAIERGERGEVQPLPFGSWLQFPFVISHTSKAGEYKEYVRVYPPSNAQENNFDFKTQVKYLLNGVEVNKDQIKDLCLASETSEKDKPECMTISSENIIKVGEIII